MDIELYQKDNTKCLTLQCDVPEICKTEPCWLGIDEAGRGPVLGPMVYGTCFSPVSMKEKLSESRFADSKTLTEEQREKLFNTIEENNSWIGWLVEILSPMYISNSMLRRAKYNLNALSHDCAIGMIQKALDQGAMITEVYVDTVGDPAKYEAKLKALFPQICTITVAKKADSLYPIVSAASICAKVARDRAVKTWHFIEEGMVTIPESGYGSGYPSDPNTKKFLAANLDPVFGYTSFVRFGWSTAANVIDSKCAQAHWEDDDDDEEDSKTKRAAKNTPSLLSMFARKEPKKEQCKQHSFFKERALSSVAKF